MRTTERPAAATLRALTRCTTANVAAIAERQPERDGGDEQTSPRDRAGRRDGGGEKDGGATDAWHSGPEVEAAHEEEADGRPVRTLTKRTSPPMNQAQPGMFQNTEAPGHTTNSLELPIEARPPGPVPRR